MSFLFYLSLVSFEMRSLGKCSNNISTEYSDLSASRKQPDQVTERSRD